MAEVWRATDTKLRRTVAVKVILDTHAREPQFLERFLREARVVASLEHPNILPVYDFGEEQGLLFLVMPHMDGGTLRDRMVGQPIPLAQAVGWIRQIASALDAAHEAGVLHRDVKPANVLIGKGERLALADFGIARMLETASGLTATGVVVGTPMYMAPEQAQGKPATPATDRYSLAVVAFELLSGKPPFGGDNPFAVMHQHVTTPAPSLSTKVGGLPAGLDEILGRGLSKNPEERPLSCRVFAEAIAAFAPTGALPLLSPTAPWSPPAPPPAWTPPPAAPVTPPHATAPTVRETPAGTTPMAASIPPRVRVATPAAGLTSDPTVFSSPGRPARRILLAVLLVAAAAGAGVVWLRRKEAVPPAGGVAPAAAPVAAAPTALPTVAPTATPLAVTVVEMPTSALPAPSPTRVVRREPTPNPRLEQLSAAVDNAIARGALSPPEEKNALDALATLKKDFPGAPRVVVEEGRIAEAFAHEAAGHLKNKDFASARADLLQARALRPEDAKIDARLKEADAGLKAQAAAAAAAPQPAAGEEADEAEAAPLKMAQQRLDVSHKPQHRLSREDFEFALNAARLVLAKRPHRPEAWFLETYSQGGLLYLARRDHEAGQYLLNAILELRRAGKRDPRGAGFLLAQPDGSLSVPSGWQLAVVYGDARGEADSLVDQELKMHPKEMRALLGRALLRRMQGREDAAIADARTVFDANRGPGMNAGCAEFLGESFARKKDWNEALRWFRTALQGPAPFGAAVAMRAALMARDRLRDEAQAREFFGIACRAGAVEACREAGMEPPASVGR